MKNNFVKIEKAKKQSKIVLLPTKNDCTKIVNQFNNNKISNKEMWDKILKQVNK